MRVLAIVVLILVCAVAVVFSSFGASSGYNTYRIGVELLVFASALGFLLLPGSNRATRVIALSVALPASLALAILTLPVTDGARKEILDHRLAGQGRGLVLGALGRPDFTDPGGIGTARAYGFRSGTRPNELLVVSFRKSREGVDMDDKVEQSDWLEHVAAVAAFDLHPVGPPVVGR